jgi:hypothetical protein
MDTLNKQMLVKHIEDKREGYLKRQAESKSKGERQEFVDYQIRILVLDNLLLRINKGEFNVWTVKDERPATDESEKE